MADPDSKEPSGHGIIDYADVELSRGRVMMDDEDLAVFVAAFEKGGFDGPHNYYRNFTRNWQTTADVEQKVTMPTLMIYGDHDMVPKADMDQYVEDLEIHNLDCGHWIQQEQPEATNRILLDWLERRMAPLVKAL